MVVRKAGGLVAGVQFPAPRQINYELKITNDEQCDFQK